MVSILLGRKRERHWRFIWINRWTSNFVVSEFGYIYMKTSELTLHQSMDMLSNDDMWVVMGSVEHAVGKATGNFWLILFTSNWNWKLELKFCIWLGARRMKTTDLPKINKSPPIYYRMVGFIVTIVSMHETVKLPMTLAGVHENDWEWLSWCG